MATNNDEKFDKAYTPCLVKITKEGLWEMSTKLIGKRLLWVDCRSV